MSQLLAFRIPFHSDADNADELFADSFQRELAHWNRARLAPQFPSDDWRERLENDTVMLQREGEFIEQLRLQVREAAQAVPTEAGKFMEWFESLAQIGPGQNDPLFPWLAEQATREELRWFFEQEAAGEAGFDDLVAMTQIKLPDRAKLELAANYWDEMGRGNAKGMHGPMLHIVADALKVCPSIDTTVWESLALANAMTAMASSRRYAWHSVGALGVIELTAPLRSAAVAKGLRRIGLSGSQRRYFDLHAVLDVKHSQTWNQEALLPLVSEDPRRATAIAEGALMRLTCGKLCFERYRAKLWHGQGVPPAETAA
ncbi:MAG: hypothetical protein DI555_23040 [Novosphingobium pentaromativorans]|uniref:Iron-containing redox enzyme family protein n=1 Tax=Novosphingobium pentaromativorans TaxID=205844 RepID=A0A2W5N9X6_9SPHN|nr:MAG: hypothetical protein DI555_23040 [Novosphingobium pentaromativorans]